jgi:hypothetical protein
MSKSFLDTIDKEIDALNARLADLAVTRRVVASIVGDIAPLVHTAAAKKPPVRRAKAERDNLRHEIREALYELGKPVKSREIMDYMESKGHVIERRQRVWAALSDMKRLGIVTHDTYNMTYMLTHMEKTDAA